MTHKIAYLDVMDAKVQDEIRSGRLLDPFCRDRRSA